MNCPSCGIPFEPDSNYCDQCGESLHRNINKQRSAASISPRPLARQRHTVLCASALFMVLIIGIPIFQHHKLQSNRSTQSKTSKWEAAVGLLRDLQSPDKQVAQHAADELANSILKSATNGHVRQYVETFRNDLVSDDLIHGTPPLQAFKSSSIPFIAPTIQGLLDLSLKVLGGLSNGMGGAPSFSGLAAKF